MNVTQVEEIVSIAISRANKGRTQPPESFWGLPESIRTSKHDGSEDEVLAIYTLSFILAALKKHSKDETVRTDLCKKLDDHLELTMQLNRDICVFTIINLMQNAAMLKYLPDSEKRNAVIEKIFEKSLSDYLTPWILSDLLRSIKESASPIKEKMIRIYIEHSKRQYNKNRHDRIGLLELSSRWEANVADWLSPEDLHWLEACYAYPNSPVYQLKGSLRVFEQSVRNTLQLPVEAFHFMITACISVIALDSLHENKKSVSPNQDFTQNELARLFILGLFSIYLLSLPVRGIGSLIEAHGLFKSQQPAALVFPDWAASKLEEFRNTASNVSPH